MALIPGEDSGESDEEINTEHLKDLVLTPDGSLTSAHGSIMRGLPSQQLKPKTAGIVMGEESETDEEDEESSVEQTDSSQDQVGGSPGQSGLTSFGHGSVQDISEEESPLVTSVPDPQS